ncbi:TonB-dependent receptor [Negadavirga shengliensis]|uniref:Carboxypeptidase-like regulatory domain-containing protein n=1 Tax=Negadavirga shengliensis TaxID=1389218 RepID=A0ABV9T011_9BACT
MKLLTSFFLIFHIQVWAQTTVKGVVQGPDGNPVPGANIYLQGTYEGTSSETDGSYVLQTELNGQHILVFQSMGYRSREIPVTLSGSSYDINVVLKEAIGEMNAVAISAGAMGASDEKKAVVLRPIDIVTVPGAMGDIAGAFQTLPGTAAVGNDGRLFVRGGDASETAIFIDGMKVGNAFGTTAANVPTRTRFNPNLFKGSFFSTGGYSVEYGHALSSALSLSTSDIPLRNQGDISLMSVGGGFTQTLVGEKNSITATSNYFDLSPYQALVRQNFDWERAPSGWDAEVAAKQRWGKSGMIKAYLRKESSGMQIWQPSPGVQERGALIRLQNNYTFAQSTFKQAFSKEWDLYGGISYSRNVDKLGLDQQDVHHINQVGHVKVVGVKGLSDSFSLKSGLEHYLFSLRQNFISERLQGKLIDHHSNFFTEADYYISKQWIFRGGLRSGYSSQAGQAWLDPRASLAYRFGHQGQLSLAAGKFSQSPEPEFRILQPQLQNSQSNHLIVNYLLDKNGITFRAEAFYKNYYKLLTFRGQPFFYTHIGQDGEGQARGFDFFYRDRKTFKNTDFWITYSFIDSRRKFAGYSEKVQPGFAPRHNGSVVIKHFVNMLRSQLSASFIINDGYPYTDPNHPGEMNAKTRGFQDLSLSWSYLVKPSLIIHLASNNVLGRENIFGYQFAAEKNASGKYENIPVGLQAPRFLFLGIFLTLSKDKSANQLNNL